MEDINNILNNGEVPNLNTPEEITVIKADANLGAAARAARIADEPGSLWNLYVEALQTKYSHCIVLESGW